MSDLTSAEIGALREEVKSLGDEIRKMKEEKADVRMEKLSLFLSADVFMFLSVIRRANKPVIYTHRSGRKIKEKIAHMLEKKKLLGEDAIGRFVVKFPKGTRDFGPKAAAIRDNVLRSISNKFLVHCAQKLDTPVYELKEVLLGKYGEEGGKLIFDLSDQGGTNLSLRYDLTVPFASYLALKNINHMKRYHIGKVYRRDQPVMTRGRYREFYQCIPMEPEAECLKIADEILSELGLGDFEIKLNHRAMLEGMFAVCGMERDLFKTVCSSIDKLDKVSWEEVKMELIDEKHVNSQAVNKLEKMVRMREQNSALSNHQLLKRFEDDEEMGRNARIQKAINDLRILLNHCKTLGIEERITFEPSLARGLDYYTGAIFETVYKDFSISLGDMLPSNEEKEGKTHVGTVAAGGRYDNLVEMFSATGEHVPCVGISFGVERLFSIMELKAQVEKSAMRTTSVDIYVGSAQKNLVIERLNLCRELWNGHVKAEMPYKVNPKMLNQLQYCEERSIPLIAIVGEREIADGVVKLRDVATREEKDVPRSELLNELKQRIPVLRSDSELRYCTVNERISQTINECFKRHGAESIDTPVFELRDVMLGKYGKKNEKCFVDLKDQGGEITTMRYDLTVPFARYLAMNKIQNMKRYHIGKIYRRDQGALGTVKEFAHCDFDIAGQFDLMLPDAECLRIAVEVLMELGLQNFEIRLNHCSLLEGLITSCGVEVEQLNLVLSCLEGSDKLPWEAVSSKLSQETQLLGEVVAKLQHVLRPQKSAEKATNNLFILELFENGYQMADNSNIKNALSDLRLILQYCERLGAAKNIVIDPSLAPWFPYYTGIIFTVSVKTYGGAGESSATDSLVVAKGGRYDNLVSTFLSKKQRVPCVGLSFSMNELERILFAKVQEEKLTHCLLGIEIFVAFVTDDLLQQRQKLLCELWNHGLKAEMCSFIKSAEAEIRYCEENSIPIYLTLNKEGKVKVRDVKNKSEEVFSYGDVMSELLKKLKISKAVSVSY